MLQRTRYFQSKSILLFLCIVFLVSLIAAPAAYQRIGRMNPSGTVSSGAVSPPILQESKSYLISETPANEFLNDLRISLISNRSVQNFQNIIIRVLNILLPFVAFRVLIYCFGYFNRRRFRHKSIMAISIGGHAPPRIITA